MRTFFQGKISPFSLGDFRNGLELRAVFGEQFFEGAPKATLGLPLLPSANSFPQAPLVSNSAGQVVFGRMPLARRSVTP